MHLQIQYESNLVNGGSSSPMYRTILNGGVWGAWNVLSASIPMRSFQIVGEPGNVLAVYALGGDGRVYRLTQFHPGATPMNWNGWYGGGNVPLAQMQVLVVNGQIAILGLGLDRKAYFSYLSGSSWTAWAEPDGPSPLFLQLGAAVTHDNRIVVFGVLFADDPADRKVKYIEQTAPAFTSTSWGAWNELGTSPAVTQIACQATPDRRLAVFAVDDSSYVQMIQQTQAASPTAAWDSWTPIGATPPTVVSVAPTTTPDNRLAVFSIGATQRTIWTIQQSAVAAPATTWDSWATLSGSPGVQAVAPIVYGGSLHLFAHGWSMPLTPEQLSRVNRKAVVKYFRVSP